jgi:multiple sugar transport system permease protein
MNESTKAAAVPTRRRRRPSLRRWLTSGGLSKALFALPLIFVFGVFSWYPIGRSVVMSLQKTNFITAPSWVGLDNFRFVLEDPLLGQAVWNTVQFTFWSVLIGFPLPIVLAVFIGELTKGRTLASILAYIPAIVPPVVAVLLWKQLYDPDPNGLFNVILGWFGAGPAGWLNDGHIAIPAMVVEMTWAGFGSTTIVYLSSLMSVRTELYEAAEIDGASIRRRIWHITLPQLRSILLLMFLLQIINLGQLFTEPYIMTGGGPRNQTLTVMLLVYRYAFADGNYGKATALSVMLAVVLAIISAVYQLATRKWSTS